MNDGKNGKPSHDHDAEIQHNAAYETDSIPNNQPLSNASGCTVAVADDNGNGGNNTVSLQTTNDDQSPHDDATYNHITNGPTTAITIDKTYAHIPNTAAARFDNTYSHVSSQENRHEQDNVNELEDSTYNHLGLSDPSSYLSGRKNNRHIRVKTNSRKDDTYSHISPNNNKARNKKSNAAYEDSTYHHLSDTHVHHLTKSVPCGQRPNISNKISAHTGGKKNDAAGRYDYAVVNKP